MPADLDQFGRKNSHGTIIGRKGLVQLGHGTADRRGFLDQINKEPAIGQIEGGLDTGDATPNYHHHTFNAVIGMDLLHSFAPFLFVVPEMPTASFRSAGRRGSGIGEPPVLPPHGQVAIGDDDPRFEPNDNFTRLRVRAA